MRSLVIALLLAAVPAVAQTMSPPPGDLGSLPSDTADPAQADTTAPRGYLLAAIQALANNQLDVAREALEHAETRVLTRSVPRGRPQQPSDQALVAAIDDARNALAAGDRSTTLQKIDEALSSPDLDAPTQ